MNHLLLSVLVLASTNSIKGRSKRQGVSVVQGTLIRQLDDPNGASTASIPIPQSDQENVMVRPPNLAQDETDDPTTVDPLDSNGSGNTISEPTVASPISTISEPTVALTLAPSMLNTAGNAPVSTISEPTMAPPVFETGTNRPVNSISDSPIAPTTFPSMPETGDNAPVSLLSKQPIAPAMVPSTVFSPAITPWPSSEGPWSPAPTPTEYQLISHLPSNIPSDLPSRFLSPSPTRQQTTLATMYPTDLPSSSSPDSPTWEPTPYPTQGSRPSPTMDPTDLPSSLSTDLPTWEPTPYVTQGSWPSPTIDPTDLSSPSSTDVPTWEPTPYVTQGSWPSPSKDPTREPSRITTDTPSSMSSGNMSSVFPSASALPTSSAFVTIRIDENGNPIGDGDGGNSTDQNGGLNGGEVALLSECAGQPANETGASTNVLEFQYVMILKPAISADSVVMEIEPILHRQIGVEFLTCDMQEQRKLQQATNDTPFTVMDLSSLPMDKVAGFACADDDLQSSDDGFNCFVVDAGFTSKMLFSASPGEVLKTIASFLTELMASERWRDANQNIQRLAFRGFRDDMVTVAPTPSPDDENDPNGAKGQLYNKPMDEGFLDEGSGPTLPVDGVPSFIVIQDDESKDSSGYGATANVVASYHESMAAWGHDSRTCKSTTCAECQADKLLVPTFVPADVMKAQIKRDLAPLRPPRPRPGFIPKDTVEL
ncbi:hypothetical protein MHU86_23116 [Fragilaria crotonensis]|nr:hypothetical protein MHU86_23116 [Fragilaria crotonensis]